MNRNRFAYVVIFSLCFAVSADGAQSSLDDFSSGDAFYARLGSDRGRSADTVDTATVYGHTLGGVIGGSREVTFRTSPVTHTYEGDSYTVNHGVEGRLDPDGVFDGAHGLLSMSSEYGGVGGLSLRYDGEGRGLNLDLLGATHITVRYRPDHHGFGKNSWASLTLGDGRGAHMQMHTWSTPTVPGPGWSDLRFDLLPFRGGGGGGGSGLDMGNIQTIQFDYEGDDAHDVVIDEIVTDTTVPEPASVALLGIGSVGCLIRRRRRRR